MRDQSNWSFPANLQPSPKDVRYDLDAALAAVVKVHAEIPEDAFTADTLGVERTGSGVVIRDDGLILTIGYLITEAQSIWLTTNHGVAVPGHPLAYDQASGFGLILPLGRLGVPTLPRGHASTCRVGDDVVLMGSGGRAHSLKARIVAKREFAGYWEYLLEEALFTAPAHPQWGGTALIGESGELLGIGSLLVHEGAEEKSAEGNMVVPIDLLDPIFEAMLATGRPAGPPRPWLGLYATEVEGHLVVGGVARQGPADRAGVRVGDLVVEVAGQPVAALAELYRTVWALGPAGTDVPLTLVREGTRSSLRLRSVDRAGLLKKPRLH